MDWLNYHHLLYFHVTAKEGSIAKASEQLLLAQPTISGQIHALEESFGEKLFQRSGRRLLLTDFGRIVFEYTEEIFGTGRELMDFVRGRPTGRPLRFTAGISDSLPKTVVARLLEPALRMDRPVHLVAQEDHPEDLVLSLSQHRLDVLLTDEPPPNPMRVRLYHHLIGESAIALYAQPRMAAALKKKFPQSLAASPMLLPLPNSGLRKALDQWFQEAGIRPHIVGEFQDTALAKQFGESGLGVFPAPVVVDSQIRKAYDVARIGDLPASMRFYAVSMEKRFRHPAVLAILRTAKEQVFAPAASRPSTRPAHQPKS